MLKEKNEQEIFVRYCELKGIVCVFIANGIPISNRVNKYAYLASLKAQGYKTGFPDLLVLAHNSTKDMLFIEFKREKGGKLSPKQVEWQKKLNDLGYDSYVAKGSKHAIAILEEWLTK